ncbi:MAG: DUF4162 domain-containing protein, partial [Gammaproteobacteria bacterium]|nr:DUF4162 domain-containing protein [Gammaproteobacteria bacterium]
VTWGAVADVVGEGSAVLLRADDTKALAGAMEAYPGASSVRRTDDGLVATLDSGDLASVTRYLAGQGIYLSHLAPYRPSLEEVFIDVTQGAVDSMTEMAS